MALYRLHRTLAPCSPQKINSLYCFDSIARACRSKVKKGIGAKIEKTGTFAGLLQQIEGVLDGLVDDLIKQPSWNEGRVSTTLHSSCALHTGHGRHGLVPHGDVLAGLSSRLWPVIWKDAGERRVQVFRR